MVEYAEEFLATYSDAPRHWVVLQFAPASRDRVAAADGSVAQLLLRLARHTLPHTAVLIVSGRAGAPSSRRGIVEVAESSRRGPPRERDRRWATDSRDRKSVGRDFAPDLAPWV